MEGGVVHFFSGFAGEFVFFCVVELEGGGFEFEVIEREMSGEGEAAARRGDEGARGHRNHGGAGVAGLDLETMPEGVGDLAEFALRDEVEIEEDEGEITIAEEEIGGLDRLLSFMTTDPDEVAALSSAIRGGIERVAAIDESEWEVSIF